MANTSQSPIDLTGDSPTPATRGATVANDTARTIHFNDPDDDDDDDIVQPPSHFLQQHQQQLQQPNTNSNPSTQHFNPYLHHPALNPLYAYQTQTPVGNTANVQHPPQFNHNHVFQVLDSPEPKWLPPNFRTHQAAGVRQPDLDPQPQIDHVARLNSIQTDAHEEADTPPELNVDLHPHQKRALCWMAKREQPKQPDTPYYDLACFGGILADDQGLGKTLTTISLLFKNPPKGGQPWQTLIVCPLSLVDQWKKELVSRTRAGFGKSVHIYHGAEKAKTIDELKSYDLVISTYGTITAEARLPDYQTLLFRFKWHRVVLDESHNVRNQRTARYKAVEKLRAGIRWALSGTPVQNSVDDIYSLLEFIGFKIAFNKEEWKSQWKRRLECSDPQISTLQYNKLKTILGIVMLRRTKNDTFQGKPILTLPPRVTHMLEKELTYPDEQRVYMETLVKSVMVFESAVSGGALQENMSAILTRFLRMRQACFHPFLIEYASYLRKVEQIKKDGDVQLMSKEEKQFARLVKKTQSKFARRKAAREDEDDEEMEDAPFSDDSEMDDFIDDRPEQEIMQEAEENRKKNEVDDLMDMAQGVLAQPASGDPFSVVDLTGEEEPALLSFDSKSEGLLDFGNLDLEDMWNQAMNLPALTLDGQQDGETQANHVPMNPKEMKKKMQEALMKPSTKMDMLIEKLNEIRDDDPSRKSLVFSQWTTCLDIVQSHLEKAGFGCCRLDGTMRMADRKEEIKTFEETTKEVLLISLRAGGEGLNLVVASSVFLVDAWWNPAVEEQAIDRVHRIGQKRDVHIYRFKMKNTFETFVYQVSDRKKDLIAGTIGGEGGSMSASQPRLTMEDFKTLFKGAAENLIQKGATGKALAAARTLLEC